MAELVKLHADKKFNVIGINTDSDLADYKKKAHDSDVTWRNAWSANPSGGVPSVFGIQAFPTVILVDKTGVARWQGNFMGEDGFAETLETLLAETK